MLNPTFLLHLLLNVNLQQSLAVIFILINTYINLLQLIFYLLTHRTCVSFLKKEYCLNLLL